MNKITRLQQAMPASMQAIVLRDGANRFYLTGMKSSAGTVLATRNKAWLLIDFRYLEEAENKVKNCTVLEEKNLYAQIKTLLEAEQITSLSVHAGLVSLEEFRKLQAGLPGITLDGSEALSTLMDTLRREKDEDEIACHRKAQQITDHTFSHICGYIRPGVTETDIAREIGVTLTALGSDDKNFNFIVASGPNSSLPHGFATNRLVRKGDFVTMDFGCVYRGYCSDMTRTVAVGHVTEEMRRVYDTVLTAQKAGIAAARAGVTGREVDGAARRVIEEAGYGPYFGHSFGHGVGVEIHEAPNAAPSVETALPAGAVISAEPGIYLPGKLGVRIEDVIILTEDGCRNLTRAPKELLVL